MAVRVINPSIKTGANTSDQIKIPYSSIDGTPTIPTKTSQLTNDSGFLTSHQDISGKANLNGGNTFTGKQLFNNTVNGVTNQLALNETQWDIFTCRDLTSPTTKTAIGKGFVWCQDSDAIYSQFKATGICYGNDDRGCDCELLFPYIEDGASVEKTIATTDQIPTSTSQLTNDSGFLTSAPSNMMTTNSVQIISASKRFNNGISLAGPLKMGTSTSDGSAGTYGQFLMTRGSSAAPIWANIPSSVTNIEQIHLEGEAAAYTIFGEDEEGSFVGVFEIEQPPNQFTVYVGNETYIITRSGSEMTAQMRITVDSAFNSSGGRMIFSTITLNNGTSNKNSFFSVTTSPYIEIGSNLSSSYYFQGMGVISKIVF